MPSIDQQLKDNSLIPNTIIRLQAIRMSQDELRRVYNVLAEKGEDVSSLAMEMEKLEQRINSTLFQVTFKEFAEASTLLTSSLAILVRMNDPENYIRFLLEVINADYKAVMVTAYNTTCKIKGCLCRLHIGDGVMLSFNFPEEVIAHCKSAGIELTTMNSVEFHNFKTGVVA